MTTAECFKETVSKEHNLARSNGFNPSVFDPPNRRPKSGGITSRWHLSPGVCGTNASQRHNQAMNHPTVMGIILSQSDNKYVHESHPHAHGPPDSWVDGSRSFSTRDLIHTANHPVRDDPYAGIPTMYGDDIKHNYRAPDMVGSRTLYEAPSSGKIDRVQQQLAAACGFSVQSSPAQQRQQGRSGGGKEQTRLRASRSMPTTQRSRPRGRTAGSCDANRSAGLDNRRRQPQPRTSRRGNDRTVRTIPRDASMRSSPGEPPVNPAYYHSSPNRAHPPVEYNCYAGQPSTRSWAHHYVNRLDHKQKADLTKNDYSTAQRWPVEQQLPDMRRPNQKGPLEPSSISLAIAKK